MNNNFIIFELTMPHVNTWDGKWTGANNYYSIVINFKKKFGGSKSALEKFNSIVGNNYMHSFGDGWAANIKAISANAIEARKSKNKSKGFMGYDWMIENILLSGKI